MFVLKFSLFIAWNVNSVISVNGLSKVNDINKTHPENRTRDCNWEKIILKFRHQYIETIVNISISIIKPQKYVLLSKILIWKYCLS